MLSVCNDPKAILVIRAALVVISALLAASVPAASPDASRYPARTLRVVVPFTPAGGADLVARTLGQRLSEQIGQMVVVDNRVGADGNIGTELVARATPDGYTLLLGYVGNLAIAPALHSRLPFDPVQDFAPITQIAAAPNILVVNTSVPVKDFAEFLSYIKANPNTVGFASAVVGSPGHLAGEMLKRRAGLMMFHIPYKGASQALVDVMGGQVQAMFGVSTVMPHIKTGKLRGLATTGHRRLAILPEVPTIAELGFPGFEATAWYGYLAPKLTSPATIKFLYDETARALKVPQVKARLEAAGFDIVGSTPSDFEAYIRSEIRKWAEVVTESGAKAE